MTKKILTMCLTLLVVVGIGAYGPGRSFQVEVVGSGRPMILIPGLASHGDTWIPTAEHFATSHESHVLTLAGFAGVPAIGRPFLETVRADLARYIRDEELEKPIVIGHSLGGFLAFWLASTEPDLVGPVISVDGLPFLPALSNPAATGETTRAAAANLRSMMALLTPEQFAAQNRTMLRTMISAPEQLSRVVETSTKSDPVAVAQATYELMTTDLRDDVARIESPVLLMGAFGAMSSPEIRAVMEQSYRLQVSAIPVRQFVAAENARHFVMLDDPEFLWRTIETFLRSRDGASQQTQGGVR